MRKKIVCLFLICILTAGNVQAADLAWAEASTGSVNVKSPGKVTAMDEAMGQEYQITADDLMPIRVLAENGLVHIENALKWDDVWYFSTDFFSEHTDYEFLKNECIFVLDENADNRKVNAGTFVKSVYIDIYNNAIQLKGKGVPLDDIIEIDGTLYLPGYQVFPYLNALCMVQDDFLIISVPDTSYAELLNNFNLSDYLFDADREFGSDVIPGDLYQKISTSCAYLFDSLKDFRLDRILFWSTGDYDDYKDIYTGYVTDQDGYNYYSSNARYQQKILGQENKIVNRYEKVLKKGVMKPFYVNLWEMFQRMGNESKSVGKALKTIKEIMPEKIYDVFEDAYLEMYVDYEDVQGGLKVAGYVFSMVSAGIDYCMNSAAIVDDNLAALPAVYPKINGTPAVTEYQLKAIKRVYETYADGFDESKAAAEMGIAFVNGLRDEIIEDAAAMMIGEGTVAPFKFAAWLTGEVVPQLIRFIADKVFKIDIGFGAIDDLALMNYHLGALEEAKDSYELYLDYINSNGEYTQDNLEKLRLSAILALLVSKKCYETMRDNASDLNKDYKSSCDFRIENIEKKLADLYEAGAGVAIEGREYFEAASEVVQRQLEPLKTCDDTVEKAYAKVIAQDGIMGKIGIAIFLEDILGNDGIPEMMVTDYTDEKHMLTFYQLMGDEVKQLTSIDVASEKDSGAASCVILTDDKDGNAGILELKLNDANISSLTSANDLHYDTASWRFSVLSPNGLEEKAYGDWQYSKKGKSLEETIADYANNPFLLMRNWSDDGAILLAENRSYLLTDNSLNADFWFGYLGEAFFTKNRGNEYGLVTTLFEYAILTQTFLLDYEPSYLVTDADQDGAQELLMIADKSWEGTTAVLAADLNNAAAGTRVNGSAAGGLYFSQHTTDGRTLLREYYYSAMHQMDSFYEWIGTAWEQKSYMTQEVKEDIYGNWVSEGSGVWWGEEVTTDDYYQRMSSETIDILYGYNPDLSCIQLQGNASDYLEELYEYLIKDGRKGVFGDTVKDLTVAYTFGDLDLDGVLEDIYVLCSPADPWMSMIRENPDADWFFSLDESCSIIIVADEIDQTTLQLTLSYHWNDFGGEIWDSDLYVIDGVLYVRNDSFAYNGTYIMNMDYIG